MALPDMHPLLSALLCLLALAGATFGQQAVVVFWRVDKWQARRTVVWCRFVALLAAVWTGSCVTLAVLYGATTVARPVAALYAWLVL